MKYKIPDIKKILMPTWLHNPGEAVNQEGWYKQKILMQGTRPKDKKILEKLGIKKKDKVLALAGFYGDWAWGLQKNGAKVDYSDISRKIVAWVKKQKDRKFERYIVSDYINIPKRELKYDWSFTYEACGGGQGLPLAYLKSLLNKKGGILVLCFRPDKPNAMGSKIKRYPLIVKMLEKAYGAKAKIIRKRIKAHRREMPEQNYTYIVHKILTNPKARKLAKKDFEFLIKTKNKKIFPQKEKDSIKRLNILAKAMNPINLREVEVKS